MKRSVAYFFLHCSITISSEWVKTSTSGYDFVHVKGILTTRFHVLVILAQQNESIGSKNQFFEQIIQAVDRSCSDHALIFPFLNGHSCNDQV